MVSINDIIMYFYNLLFHVEESHKTVMLTILYYELIDNVLCEFYNLFSELNYDIIKLIHPLIPELY